MALKEAKVQQRRQAKASANANANANANAVECWSSEAILRSVQDPGDRAAGLAAQLKLYLAPLAASRTGPGGKENGQGCQEHALAKQHLPFLVQLLKLCSSSLAAGPGGCDGAAQGKADELLAAMALALDCLHQLRAWLAGCCFEIEIQRYRLVRLLITWKRYKDAGSQCWELYRSLCSTVLRKNGAAAEPKAAASGKESRQRRVPVYVVEDVSLPPPQPGEDSTALPMLVTGVAVDLFFCTAENGNCSSDVLRVLLSLPERLNPWFRILPSSSAEKQRDSLFKAVYKMACKLVEGVESHEAEVVQKFCVLALHCCALSSQCGQYARVARRLCSSLSSHAPMVAVSVCRACLSEMCQMNQLCILWNNPEVLDLLDSFARLCQAANCNLVGAEDIQGLSHRFGTNASILAGVAGLYAVGLLFAETEQIGEGKKICQLLGTLDSAAEGIQLLLSQESTEVTNRKIAKVVHSKVVVGDSSAKLLASVFKALDYVRRLSAKFVQTQWNTYISSSCSTKIEEPFRRLMQLLEQILHLLFLVVQSGLRGTDSKDAEREVLERGHKSVSAAAVAALKLSVLTEEKTERHLLILRHILRRTETDEEELRWLMSSSYNVGVQMFNATKYGLAGGPLRLAYESACATMDLKSFHKSAPLSDLESVELSSVVSECLGKCVALVDVLIRCEDYEGSSQVLVDGLYRWGRAQALMVHVPRPRQLIRLWVKGVCTRNGASHLSLLNLLCKLQPPLPSDILGSIMEEELSVYDGMENELSKVMRGKILNLLLEQVYTASKFSYERSRVLLEISRISRLEGPEQLSNCTTYLSEAVSLLDNALGQERTTGSKSMKLKKILHQSGITRCVRALCMFEIDPSSEIYIDDIIVAVNHWREALKFSNASTKKLVSEKDDNAWLSSFGKEAVCLLCNVADLASLKGYSVLQDDLHDLIYDLVAGENLSKEEIFTSLLGERQVGHALCLVPHSGRFSASLSKNFGLAVDSIETWQRHADNAPTSELGALMRLVARDISPDYAKTALPDAFMELKQTRKSCHSNLGLSQVHHSLAQQALGEGNLVQAQAYAKEALQMRFRCFSRTFMASNTGTVPVAESSSTAGISSGSSNLAAIGHVAAHAWPAMHVMGDSDVVRSQWHVLGKYLESLFQVGLIHEKTGAVDDAEKNLREGLRVATALSLRLAQATFASAIGELHRKRHLWKLAVESFAEANRIYYQSDMTLACKSCIQAGRALLRIRIGDLVRRCDEQQLVSTCLKELLARPLFPPDPCLENLDDPVIWSYTRAKDELLSVIGSGTSHEKLCSCVIDKSVLASSSQESGRFPGEHLQRIISIDKVDSRPRRSTRNASCQSSQKSESDLQDLLCEKLEQVSLGVDTGAPVVIQQKEVATTRTGLPVKRSARLKQKLLASGAAPEIDSGRIDDCPSSSWSDTLRNPQRKPRSRKAVLCATEPGPVSSKSLTGLEGTRTAEGWRRPSRQKAASVEPRPGSGLPPDKEAGCHAPAKGSEALPSAHNEETDAEWLRNTSHETASTSETRCNCSCGSGKRARAQISSMQEWTAFKWEQSGRRLLAKAFTQKGKTYLARGHHELAENCFLESWAFLHECRTMQWQDFQAGTRIPSSPSSLFPLEEAALLYHMSLLRLRRELATNSTRIDGTGLQQSLTWLYRSFLLCQQTPPLLRKVAQLLALLHVPISAGGVCHHSGRGSGELHSLAAYFQQASIGATARQQHLTVVNSRITSETDTGLSLASTKSLEEMQQALRIVPEGLNAVEAWADGHEWLIGLEQSTVCCIGFVDTDHVSLIQREHPTSCAWLFVTRIGAEPSVILLPAAPLTKGVASPYYVGDEPSTSTENDGKHVLDVLQKAIPEFASIMEESRQSTAETGPLTTSEQKTAWWKWRTELDFRLSSLLSTLEDLWLGPWKCFLLGRPSDSAVTQALKISAKALSKDLKEISKQGAPEKEIMEVDENLVHLLLQGLGCLSRSQLEAGLAWLIGWNRSGFSLPGEANSSVPDHRQQRIGQAAEGFAAAYNAAVRGDKSASEDQSDGRTRGRSRIGRQTQQDAAQSKRSVPQGKDSPDSQPLDRQPVELVLDSNLQKLPWESLPCLRDYESYRMPSVGSLRALLIHRSSVLNELPTNWLNVSDAYYLLNPSGDLASTQAAFEDWFSQQEGWKGKAGEVPSVDDCLEGLTKHDLFVYFGHGSGEQYLPERRIRRLEKCAAALLMGCGSGRLADRGDYEPVGIPLSYLMAGCPTAIANLWDVTDGDIDRFSRVLLHSWLAASDDAPPAAAFPENACRESSRSRMAQYPRSVVHMGQVSHGRNACKLPFLIGAAPVSYGVPTPIYRRG